MRGAPHTKSEKPRMFPSGQAVGPEVGPTEDAQDKPRPVRADMVMSVQVVQPVQKEARDDAHEPYIQQSHGRISSMLAAQVEPDLSTADVLRGP